MRYRVAVVTGALAVLALSGCSEDAEAGPAPTPPVESQPDESGTCAAFSDVLSILENADIALSEGRMDAQEHRGWYHLAGRVLERLPSGGDGALHDALAALQEIDPATVPGKGLGLAAARAPEWYDAQEPLGAACDELGTPVVISMMTGG